MEEMIQSDGNSVAPHSDHPVAERDAWKTEDLPLVWRARAQAFRIVDKHRDTPDAFTLAQAEAFDECAAELKSALGGMASDLDSALLDIIGELGAALIQQCASDDKIIMDHVRNAHEQAKAARRLIGLTGNGYAHSRISGEYTRSRMESRS